MDPTIGIGILTFNNPLRLRRVLECIETFGWPDVPVRIVEDPWRPEVQATYDVLARDFPVTVHRLEKWGCMQGAAQRSVELTPEDWWLYLSDDVLPTPGCLENVLKWIKRVHSSNVGLLQIPYWNIDELPYAPLSDKNLMWNGDVEWLRSVPPNPHWGTFKQYINCNGAGFAMRRALWEEVGGFRQETWCFDEEIAARAWLKTEYSVAALPGPPLVHYMGACLEHPPHQFHTMEAWRAAGWEDKSVVAEAMHAVMATRPVPVYNEPELEVA